MKPPLTENPTFVPGDWNRHFSSLTDEERRSALTRVCRAVLAFCPLDELPLHDALCSLEQGTATGEHVNAVTVILERFESEYDRLVGDDEGKLVHSDPGIKDIFQKVRTASVVKFAMEGKLTDMAYEAWWVLGELSEVRRLTGMPL